MKKRLEQRTDRKEDKGDTPSRRPQRCSSSANVVQTDDSSKDAGKGVRLPHLDQAAPSNGMRRCSSQPPAVPGGPSELPPVKGGKPQGRPQSMGARKGAPGAHAKDDDGEKCGRQMFDKNTLRKNNKPLFSWAIRNYRDQLPKPDAAAGAVNEQEGGSSSSSAVKVYVRKRPIFEKEEVTNGDYDVLTVLPQLPVPTQAVLHNCLFQADLKTPFISHCSFRFDHIFDEGCNNEEVYRATASSLVQSALGGRISTMFMFGQTGSGKTHTMSSIEEMAARDLFKDADGAESWLLIQFIELCGNRCNDLLAPSVRDAKNKPVRPELRLREQGDGSYVADGAVELAPTTPEELVTVMRMAHARRATSATDANAVSSRSHAVCTLRLVQSEGQLMLVDCAGTERRKDSMYHSKERQQEGAEINASLHALKECIRFLTTQNKVPSHAFRASALTKVLAEAFVRGSEARLAVICTASPCASDTEHTVATLRTGAGLCSQGSEREDKQVLLDFIQAMKKPKVQHPKTWTPEQVRDWISEIRGGNFRFVLDSLPSNFTGQMLVRLTETRCVQLCGGNQKKGRLLFDLLHEEIQKT